MDDKTREVLWSAMKEAGAVLILPDHQAYSMVLLAHEAVYGKIAHGTNVRLFHFGVPIFFLSEPAQEVMALFREAHT